MFVAYRIGGVNWAVTVGTVLGVSTWLWSARKTFREQAANARAELTVDRQGVSADQDLERLSYRRIRVKNTGNRPLAQIEVKLVECPQHQAQFYPVRLQRMHGGAHPFDLAPGQEVYIELVALPLGHGEFVIGHDSSSHAGFPNGIPVQPLQLFVRVSARDVKPASHRFDVLKTAVGELTVVQAQEG